MVDRFDLTPCEGESGRCLADFDPADDGEWVMYEDYAKLEGEMMDLVRKLEFRLGSLEKAARLFVFNAHRDQWPGREHTYFKELESLLVENPSAWCEECRSYHPATTRHAKDFVVERGTLIRADAVGDVCVHDGSQQHTTGDEWVRCTRCGAPLSRAAE
jgi:hypothetical protein